MGQHPPQIRDHDAIVLQGLLQRTNQRGKPWQDNLEIKDMALFCDFENIALGVRYASTPSFDMRRCGAAAAKGSISLRRRKWDW